jgi:hypothetical protein
MASTPKERVLQICDELGEDLDSPSCKALREFIQTCPNCAAFVDSVKKTIRLYQEYRPTASGEVRVKLLKTLNLNT